MSQRGPGRAACLAATPRRATLLAIALAVAISACVARPPASPGVIVVGVTSGPNNLDPRIGTDDVSQKIDQLIFDNLLDLDASLQVVPGLAERLDHPDPLRYVATLRRGVRFHDGHELTSADVVYTFRSLLDPTFISPLKGAYPMLRSVAAEDRYTVAFTLKAPFGSFPVNLVVPIVPEGAGSSFGSHPIGTGPYRFIDYRDDDRLALASFDQYHGGRVLNEGLLLKVIPDDIMRGLELRKGTIDLVVNDLAPDIVYQLRDDPALQVVESPGTDYQYIGCNLRDPALRDIRVRQAIGYAIDRDAIVKYLRRGLARVAIGILPPMSWAFDPNVFQFTYDPARARALLDEAGYPDRGDRGPRLRLSLKVSNLEFNRLQSAVIQQNLAAVGIQLDVRAYEFATLYADVLAGHFQLYTLQWVGVTDPDILRRVFHSSQMPPVGYNRGFFEDPTVDRLLDAATIATDDGIRRPLYAEVQERVAREAPYISLWYKTNVAVGGRALTGIHLLPGADFTFLKNVARHASERGAAN